MGMRGRPKRFKKEYIKRVEQYFQECLKANSMPLVQDVAILLGVTRQTIDNWCKANSEFFDTMEHIKLLQQKALILGGLNGKLQSNIVIFLLKANHGFIEKQHLIHTGGDQGDEPITYVVRQAPPEYIEKVKREWEASKPSYMQ